MDERIKRLIVLGLISVVVVVFGLVMLNETNKKIKEAPVKEDEVLNRKDLKELKENEVIEKEMPVKSKPGEDNLNVVETVVVEKVENADFRNVKWDFTKEDVLKYEEGRLVIDFVEEYEKIKNTSGKVEKEENIDNIVIFEDYIEDSRYEVVYSFDKENRIDKVIMTNNDNKPVTAYSNTLKFLNEKYKTNFTLKNGVVGDDEEYREMFDNLDENEVDIVDLINKDKLAIAHKWSEPRVEIVLSLASNKGRAMNVIKFNRK